MDVYPLNLILAVATASATIFLGFLPTKSIRFDFFARETLRTALAWVFVALASSPAISHFPLVIAILCFVSWWKFRHDHAFSGKMWLTLASGLGISIGVMLILAVTPRAFPPGLSQADEALPLASIYLGGGVIGLAYVCYVLTKSASSNSGVTNAIVRRYIDLLLFLVLARAAVLLVEIFMPDSVANDRIIGVNGVRENGTPTHFSISAFDLSPVMIIPVLILVILAFLAQRATRLNSRILPTRFLMALIVLGIIAEILARLVIL